MTISPAKLSIILPFFNADKTLYRAISSIAKQSFTEFECILVDNNSTDGSGLIAREWVSKDSRFMLTHEKRQNVVFAFNHGASLAKGEYLARMDADDEALHDRFRLQVDFLDSNPDYGAVAGQAIYIAHKTDTKGFDRYVNWSNSILSFDDISKRRFIEMPVINPTAMWRKSVSEKHGLVRNGDFPEDYEMWLRWLHNGVRIHKLDVPVINWYDSSERLTRTDNRYSSDAFYRIKTQYLSEWLKENNNFHPKVAIWGGSPKSRKHAQLLEDYGIEISFYIDIKKQRQIDKQLVYFEELPEPSKVYVLVYMGLESARRKIQLFLEGRNFKEGQNYLLVS